MRVGHHSKLGPMEDSTMDDRSTAGTTTFPRADDVLEQLNTAAAPGATCATLTPAIRSRLREMQGGQVLEVRVDDPGAREDIAAWCRLAGHELLAVVEAEPHQLQCYIRKKIG